MAARGLPLIGKSAGIESVGAKIVERRAGLYVCADGSILVSALPKEFSAFEVSIAYSAIAALKASA